MDIPKTVLQNSVYMSFWTKGEERGRVWDFKGEGGSKWAIHR